MSNQTYASKAAAKKGAARKGIEIGVVEFVKTEEGRWTWQEVALEVVVEELEMPVVPVVEVVKDHTKQVPAVGIKIEKDRPEQNGVRRPSVGGKCRAIWDKCDELRESGAILMPKEMREIARENGWNENNSVIEMYQWRRFNGLKSRA